VKCIHLRNPNNSFEGAFTSIPKISNISINRNKSENQLNLLVLGFDSVSRVGFERFMPQTKQFLMDELEAVFFDKYTILGDGTPPGILLKNNYIKCSYFLCSINDKRFKELQWMAK